MQLAIELTDAVGIRKSGLSISDYVQHNGLN